MASTTRTKITYETTLLAGIREEATDAGEDEPFIIQLNRVTSNEVYDGRGRNWRDSSKHTEEIARLSVTNATDLAASIVSDLDFCLQVATRRLLEPKED